MKVDKKWPLLIAIPIWIAGAVLAYYGYWWPLIIMTAFAALAGLSGVVVFMIMRSAGEQLQGVAQARTAPKRKVTGAGRGKKKR